MLFLTLLRPQLAPFRFSPHPGGATRGRCIRLQTGRGYRSSCQDKGR